MAIEFNCPGCGSTLRVPEEAKGKKARCPQCSQTVDVPAESSAAGNVAAASAPAVPVSAPSAAPPPAPPSIPQLPHDDNPYSAPAGYRNVAPSTVTRGPIRETIISAGDVFSHTWDIYKREMGSCIGAMLLLFAVVFGISIGSNLILSVVQALLRDVPILVVILSLISVVGSQLAQIWLSIGMWMFYLQVARGMRPDMSVLFQGGRYVLSTIGASLIFGIAIAVVGLVSLAPAFLSRQEELLFLAVPIIGIFSLAMWLIYGQFAFAMIDQDLGAIDSLTTSQRITRGNRVSIFVIYLMTMGLLVGGVLMCGIGILFTMPLAYLLWTVAYLHMTGQARQAEESSPFGS